MKEQDYIKIMDGIRPEHIEEAVSWDASAQQNRRSIRRLSLGIGAVAAAIAVVAGSIGYGAYRSNLTVDSGADSMDISEEGVNIFGGHGAVTGFLSNNYTMLFRDDENYYLYYTFQHSYVQWAINGSTGMKKIEINPDIPDETGTGGLRQTEKELNLLTDGERLYTYHDGHLYITDGCGNETDFMSVPWNPIRIQHLGGDYYFLMTNIEDSWIDGSNPQPYIHVYAPGGDQPPVMQFTDYGDVRADDRGEHIYFRRENKIYSAPIQSPNHNQSQILDAGEEPDRLIDWTVADDFLFYITPLGGGGTMTHSGPVNASNMNDTDTDVPIANFQNGYDYYCKQKPEHCKVGYYNSDDGKTFEVAVWTGLVLSGGEAPSDPYIFSVSAAELWGDDLPDTGVCPNMDIFDTGAYIIFTLPQDGIHGEQLVQFDKETGEYQYFGENYAPERPQDDAQPEDTPAPEAVPQKDSGYCSPDVFPIYYIPQEHLDSNQIECYRMLPAVKASEAHFDADVLQTTLPQGGGFFPDPNQHLHIGIDEARKIILDSGDPLDAAEIYKKLSDASNGYAGKYPEGSSGRVGYEFWLADDGSEFITAFFSFEGEQDHYEFVYFRYDAEAGQYAYQYIPERTRGDASAEAAETNALGGKGKIRMFCNQFNDTVYAEDDEYIYDLDNALRARKTGGDTAFETFTVAANPEYTSEYTSNPQNKRILFAAEGMILTLRDSVLYEVNPDGSLTEILALTEDDKGNPIEDVCFGHICGFANDASGRPTKLFLCGSAAVAGDNRGYQIYAVLNLKTGKYTDLKYYGYATEWTVTEDAVYMAGYYIDALQTNEQTDQNSFSTEGYHLIRFDDEGNPIRVDTDEWGFGGLVGCCFDNEGFVWFGGCKGNIRDGSLTHVSEEEWNSHRSNIRGVRSTVYKEEDPQRILLCNPSGSEPIILKEGTEYPTQKYYHDGAYSENGIIHIAVTECKESESGVLEAVNLMIYTVDGKQVSSVTVSFPKE